VDTGGLGEWFNTYLDTFAACTRGDREMPELLRYYGVPLIITSDDGVTVLTTDKEVAAEPSPGAVTTMPKSVVRQ
jgi:hypothetical protein